MNDPTNEPPPKGQRQSRSPRGQGDLSACLTNEVEKRRLLGSGIVPPNQSTNPNPLPAISEETSEQDLLHPPDTDPCPSPQNPFRKD